MGFMIGLVATDYQHNVLGDHGVGTQCSRHEYRPNSVLILKWAARSAYNKVGCASTVRPNDVAMELMMRAGVVAGSN